MRTTPYVSRRAGLLPATALAALALGGCASWNQLPVYISSYGEWPASRSAGRFVFERLPSQGSQPARQTELEALALPALQAAGFQPAAAGEVPEVRITLGAHISASAYAAWHDPTWPAPRGGRWTLSPWAVPGWSMSMAWPAPEYRREVLLLIRDAGGSGPTLYEARAHSIGPSPGSDAVLAAMFRAALSDFPKALPEPHRVSVPLP